MSRTGIGKISDAYDILYDSYGPQGWWPLSGRIGYHKGDYFYPRNRRQRYEICVGAILAQNTSWNNAQKAVCLLKEKTGFSPEKTLKLSRDGLSSIIKSSGYHMQKAEKIFAFTEYFIRLGKRTPKRHELLGVWGVGSETADSMLCYGFRRPEFVSDAYALRVARRIGWTKDKTGYEGLKDLVTKGLGTDYAILGEFHALLVEHCKRSCKKRPDCNGCVLFGICEKRI